MSVSESSRQQGPSPGDFVPRFEIEKKKNGVYIEPMELESHLENVRDSFPLLDPPIRFLHELKVLKETDRVIGTESEGVPVTLKEVTFEIPLSMPHMAPVMWRGVVSKIAVTLLDRNCVPLNDEPEFFLMPNSLPALNSSLGVSRGGILDLSMGLRSSLCSGDVAAEWADPIHRLAGAVLCDQNRNVLFLCFRHPLPRECVYIGMDVLTWIRRDRHGERYQEDVICSGARPLYEHPERQVGGGDENGDNRIFEEWWTFAQRVRPTVHLPVDTHAFELQLMGVDLDVSSLMIPITYNGDGDEGVAEDPLSTAFFRGDTARLLGRPEFVQRTNLAEGNVSLSIDAAVKRQNLPFELVPFCKPTTDAGFPETVLLTLRQYWTGADVPSYSAPVLAR